ncbi:transcription factor bHLH121-like isoform X2 [Abrus precatorius]|uniref:Transcription factor bHLH121-like isoform X2 n=1 Tax=Abrus precatorius TaxID=3816 RepID=A0A8B8M1C5_ABRPR|nr:transcription factor bHLH121-like isoform X2 [Abrus precatorius]XP_027361004.1 transcription factor bHLH121-like isoform X2 [Abrus precatorius]
MGSALARGRHTLDASLSLSLSLSLSGMRFRLGPFLDNSNQHIPHSNAKMDQWKPQDSASDSASQHVTVNPNRFRNSQLSRERERGEGGEGEDPSAARKVQKADREKLRRDRLNEHFQELGNTLDPDRPKNDKATILTETVQMLKDLTAEVNRLKKEHKALSEESREYEQRVRIMFPWTAIDHSVVMSSPYSYPVPIPISPGPISIHPALQPFPFFGNQNPGHVPNPCSMYVPYPTPTNPLGEIPPAQYASTSVSNQKESPSKSPIYRRPIDAERCSTSHDVATELELKMPGSSSTQQDCSSGERKGKHSVMKDKIITDGSASSQYSSSQGLQDSSNSVGDNPKTDN